MRNYMRICAAAAVLVFALIPGCKDEEPPPGPGNVTEPTLSQEELAVLANCEVIIDAVEAWSADDGNGLYPDHLWIENSLGRTFLSYLPGGQLLTNPHTGDATEPVMGSPANLGETGYHTVFYGTGQPVGYMVEAIDDDYQIFFEHRVRPDE